MARPILLILGVVGFLACQSNHSDPGGLSVTEEDSAGITLVKISGDVSTLPLWTLSENPLMEISGDAPPFLSSIGEVEILGNGSVLVEDNQSDELRFFDSDGTSFRLLGGPGEGPGEFRNLSELTLTPGDTIVAFDRRTYRITIFSPTGDLLRTIPVEREIEGPGTYALDVWAFDSDHFLLHSMVDVDSTNTKPRPRRNRRDAVLLEVGAEGAVQGQLARFGGGYSVQFEGGGGSSPFAPSPIIDMNSGHLVYSSGEDYQLNLSAGLSEPTRIVTWSGWRQPLTEDLVSSVRSEYEAGWEEIRQVNPQLVESMMEATFSPALLPDTLPALSGVVPAGDGRLWVSRFKPTNQIWSQEDSWHLLSAEGHPIARIALPPESKMVEARGDRVVLVTRDSLDVEYLRVFRVIEPRTNSR